MSYLYSSNTTPEQISFAILITILSTVTLTIIIIIAFLQVHTLVGLDVICAGGIVAVVAVVGVQQRRRRKYL